jgi:hypothetical protein
LGDVCERLNPWITIVMGVDLLDKEKCVVIDIKPLLF